MQTHQTASPEAPRSLRLSGARDERRKRLLELHARPLTNYVARLRAEHPEREFPDFDPLDGGVDASILFLFEKPGPMTAGQAGSGFISRDNDDPTAEATYRFMEAAGLARNRTIIWNLIPGWNGTRAIRPEEITEGLVHLSELIGLLPQLTTVVLVGRRAERAHRQIESLGLRVFASSHPSPIVRASRPVQWQAIPSQWALANAP